MADEVKRVAVVDLWTDDNRGDAALQVSLARIARDRFPGATLVGLYRFGFNEIDRVSDEISVSRVEFDLVLGGPRMTRYGGASAGFAANRLLRATFDLYTMARFAAVLVAFLLLGSFSRRLMSTGEYAAFRGVRDADLVIWKGKNFREYRSLATITRALTLTMNIWPAMALGRRIICVNASFWRITNRFAAAYYRMLVRRCEQVVVREGDSLANIRLLAPGHPRLTQAPDLSFRLMGDWRKRALATTLPLAVRPEVVAFTITDWGSGEQKRTYAGVIADLLVQCEAQGIVKAVIVPQVIRVRESNSAILEAVLASARPRLSTLEIEVIDRRLGIDELLEAYQGCRLLVGTRMHSCVFARAAGTPFIAIAYDEGAKWSILKDFWPSRFIHDYSTLDAAALAAGVGELLSRGAVAIGESDARFGELIEGVEQNIPAGSGRGG